MEKKRPAKRKNILNLLIGIAFSGYGFFRLFTYFNGAEYTNFRLIISFGFIILGFADLYRFFKSRK